MKNEAKANRNSIDISAKCDNCGQKLTASVNDHAKPSFFVWYHAEGETRGQSGCPK